MLRSILLLFICLTQLTYASKNKTNDASFQIKDVINAPVRHKGKIYFLSMEGILFESNFDQSEVKELFRTTKRSASGVAIDSNNETLFFGDGLHYDEISFFYAYSLKEKKLKYRTQIKGHLEKTPLYHNGKVFVSGGKKGMIAINAEDGKILWSINKNGPKKLHVDAKPILINGRIYFTSVYDTKAIVGVDETSGKVLDFFETRLAPKSDLVIVYPYLISLTTDAVFNEKDRARESELLVYNLRTKKQTLDYKLRGHYFFQPQISGSYVMLGMSTGDILKINYMKRELLNLDIFPEPFMAKAFKKTNDDCFFSVMGRVACYNLDNKKTYEGREYLRAVIGETSKIGSFHYFPSRLGHLVLTDEEVTKQIQKKKK